MSLRQIGAAQSDVANPILGQPIHTGPIDTPERGKPPGRTEGLAVASAVAYAAGMTRKRNKSRIKYFIAADKAVQAQPWATKTAEHAARIAQRSHRRRHVYALVDHPTDPEWWVVAWPDGSPIIVSGLYSIEIPKSSVYYMGGAR